MEGNLREGLASSSKVRGEPNTSSAPRLTFRSSPPHWLTLASSTEPTARLIAAHIALASHWHAHLLHPHPPALSKSCTRRHLGSHTPSPNGTPSVEYSCFLLSFLKSSLAQHAQHTLKPYPHLLSLHHTLQTFFVFYQAPRASLVNFIH